MQLAPTDRLLVFAPHPDDETLAAGILIQSARACGAAVRVVFATSGDNNPWPQRWLERRWRIGAGDRARWAARRREEALAALAMLGDDISARFLGWPDQGLTDCLMDSDAPVQALVAELAAFAPTHIALPDIADLHPDHGALRVMLDLALLRHRHACTLLGYTIHGGRPGPAARVSVRGGSLEVKLSAVQAYGSQLALSRRRLLALASRAEEFAPAHLPAQGAGQVSERVFEVAWPTDWPWLRPHALLLVVAEPDRVRRLRIELPRWPRGGALPHAPPAPVSGIEYRRCGLRIALAESLAPLLSVHAKVHRKDPRLFIFDRLPWQASAALPASAKPAAGVAYGVAEQSL